MNKLIRFLLWFVGAIIALTVILSIALQVFIDPNDYRGDIEAAVEDATGRQLTIEGDLSLQTFPCCGVQLGPLQLSNPEGFPDQHFVRVENAAVSVRLLPLILSQEIAVGDVELDGLDLMLISRKDGSVNWEFGGEAESEVPTEVPAEEAGSGGAPVGLAVAGVYVTDGRMKYIDELTGDEIEVSGISLTTSEIAGDDPFDFSAGLQVSGLAPDLVLKLGVDSGAVLDLDAGSVELRGLNVDVDVADLAINLQGDGLVGGDVQQLQGQFSVAEFSPRDLLKALGEPPMVTADPAVLSKSSVQSAWKLDGDVAGLSDLTILLDDTTISGAVDVLSIEQQQLNFDIQIDSIDVDRYSEPVPESASGGSGSGGEAAATGDEPLDLPVEDMRALNLEGKIGIGSLRAADTLLTNVDMSMTAKNGLIRLDPVNADIYGGTTSATVSIDVRGDIPQFSVVETLDAFQIGEYLKDTADNESVVGTTNVKLNVTARGNTTNELTKALKGDASLDVQNAKYLGIDFWHEIRAARAKIKGERAPEEPADPYTDISEISATLKFNNGIARNNDLKARIPLISLGGKGTVDILSTELDYRLEAKVTGEKEFEDGYEIDDFNGVTIPVKLTGPAGEPNIRVELDKVLKDLAKKKAEDRIMKKLGLDAEDGDDESDPKEQLKKGLRGLFDR